MSRVPLTEAVLQATNPATFAKGVEFFIYKRGTTEEVPVYSAATGGDLLEQPLITDRGGRPRGEGEILAWIEAASVDFKVRGETIPWEPGRPSLSSLSDVDLSDAAPGCALVLNEAGDGFVVTDMGTEVELEAGLATKVDLAEKGVPGGVASLDGSGKIPAGLLTVDALEYRGVWNATTNTPALADGSGSAGDQYKVSVAGERSLGSGAINFAAGDYVIYNGATWEKIDTTDQVTSVAGRQGAVVLVKGDIGGLGTAAAKDSGSAGEAGKVLAADDPILKKTGVAAGTVAAGDDERLRALWFPGLSDTLFSARPPGAMATRSVSSGQVIWYGGLETIAPAGRPVGAAKWMNFNAATSLTNCFACLGLPDESGEPWVTILATSKDYGSALGTWVEAQKIRKFSFAAADGGTGIWTPSVDTPVMLGICQIGSGIATLAGVNLAVEDFAKLQAPWWYSRNPKNLTGPHMLAGGTYELETQAVAYCGCAATESSA